MDTIVDCSLGNNGGGFLEFELLYIPMNMYLFLFIF
jgi:hypothetical protein